MASPPVFQRKWENQICNSLPLTHSMWFKCWNWTGWVTNWNEYSSEGRCQCAFKSNESAFQENLPKFGGYSSACLEALWSGGQWGWTGLQIGELSLGSKCLLPINSQRRANLHGLRSIPGISLDLLGDFSKMRPKLVFRLWKSTGDTHERSLRSRTIYKEFLVPHKGFKTCHT